MIKLYTDSVCDYVQDNRQALVEELKENEQEPNEKNIDELAQELIDDDGEQLRQAAKYFDNVGAFDSIEVRGVLGLWYGKRTGSATFKTLSECLFKFCEDLNTFYFKRKNTTLTLAATHHDGTNVFSFYYVKNGKRYAINYNLFMNGY